ncbi:MAG TPA: MarR family transcriptional regulator [Candidatus Saccharimonadales bacterium]|nr:MarR family transcriptional regulator [Candidatus Saccharimonadales bacterium]
MNNTRQDLLQSLIQKMRCVIKGMHTLHPFGELTLGRPQVGILFFIERKKEVSVKEIAEMLNVTSGAVTQFIDDLVNKNLALREESKTDRRIINIKLTKKAEDKFKEFRKNYFKTISPLFDDLDDFELQKLLLLLEKIKIANKKEDCKI